METVVLAVHYFVCVFLIVVILLQAGKGADIGAAFGGGTSQTVFGSRGAATFLSKLTSVVAIVFLMTSIRLAAISREKSKSSILKTVPGTSQPLGTPSPTAAPAALELKPPPASPAPAASPVPKGTPAPTPKPK